MCVCTLVYASVSLCFTGFGISSAITYGATVKLRFIVTMIQTCSLKMLLDFGGAKSRPLIIATVRYVSAAENQTTFPPQSGFAQALLSLLIQKQ